MNDNKDKYDNIFQETFSIEKNILGNDLEYQSIEQWDSVGHMGLMAALEEAFDIFLETDDIIDFSSYNKGMLILGNYDIKF
tara:strand:- start:647 stop:889 length:243 start_codon:yes stop_codon:yes gene_type:complete